jgi:glutathione S-transferase
VLNMKQDQQRSTDFLAVNPMGKVPAIVHDGALVTEQPAVYQYLAELYPEAGLSVPVGDPLRGPYLRWLAFYGASFEPAVIDRSMKRENDSRALSPYGDYDTTIATIDAQLTKGPYLLGEQFTAADVLWGIALNWTTMFGLVPKTPAITAYIERVGSREAVKWAQARDMEFMADREA